MNSRPCIVGISPNRWPAEERPSYNGKTLEFGDAALASSIRKTGSVPVLLPGGGVLEHQVDLEAHRAISVCDGLLLSGGADISPELYGESPQDPRWAGDPERDAWEVALYRAAIAQGKAVLGICRGMQLINVAEGGSLWQDLGMRPSVKSHAATHRCAQRYDTLEHPINIAEDSELSALFAEADHDVNSVHHQGLKKLGAKLRAVAHANDGLIEAIVRVGPPWVLGVQWHAEWMPGRDAQERIFARFVTCSRAGRGAKS